MTRASALVVTGVVVLGLTALTGLAQRGEPPDLGLPIVVDSSAPADPRTDSAEAPTEQDARRADDVRELSTDDDDPDEPDPSMDAAREAPGWVTDDREARAPGAGGTPGGETAPMPATMQDGGQDDGRDEPRTDVGDDRADDGDDDEGEGRD